MFCVSLTNIARQFMSIAYAFYVLRIVRVIYCVRDVSVANGPLSQINLISSDLNSVRSGLEQVTGSTLGCVE